MLLRAYVEGVGVECFRFIEAPLASRHCGYSGRSSVCREVLQRHHSSVRRRASVARRLQRCRIRLDVGLSISRYKKLVDTLPMSHSRDGLDIQSADLTLILLRSLPAEARSYVMLRAADESFQSLRTAVAGERDDWRPIGGICDSVWAEWRITSVTSQCHADLCGLGGQCVCVAPCDWGARDTLV